MALRHHVINQRLVAPKERIRKLRQYKAQKERQARVRALLKRLGDTGRSEALREGRRLVRHHARTQIRRFLPFY
jgi:hypothetical protein